MSDKPYNSDLIDIRLQRNLSELTSCDIAEGWSYLKNEIETQLEKALVCIPYLTDSLMYDITCIFIKIDQTGGAGRRIRTYKPLGKLEDLINNEKSHETWKNIKSKVVETGLDDQKTYQITLYDTPNEKKVRVVAKKCKKLTLPFSCSPIGKLFLKDTSDLGGSRTIYLVNQVIMSSLLELRINVGTYARVFHYGSPHPLLFGYQKYILGREKDIIGIKPTVVCSARAKWKGFESPEDLLKENQRSQDDESTTEVIAT